MTEKHSFLGSGFFGYWFSKLVLFFLFIPIFSFGQEYGLEFKGQPHSKDNRTQLDLNPEGYFTFRNEFELSFSIQLREIQTETFGYIARIVDDEDNNVDIVFNGPESHSLHVVYGQSMTNISVPDNDPDIYEKWTDISLKFNIKNRTLHFTTPDTSLVHYDFDFARKIKIFFGRNVFKPVQTTDVPRMNIKDIRLYQKDKCLHHYPLNELHGSEAMDIISNQNALVQNPVWIKPRFYFWEKNADTYMDGPSAMCFDHRNEDVYLVGEEQMKIFSALKDSIETIDYSTGFSDLIRGSQVFYDTISDRLLCYNLEIKTVYYFDFSGLRWEIISDGTDRPERFWFHNKYYSGPDSILYLLGGYGLHKYSNLVQRYTFKNQQWDTIHTSGEVFHPRMHAALGNYADTLYILGGYGSKTGDQVLNPEHYTDLLAFSLKDKKFIRKYDFKAPNENIDFAHSMIINQDDRSYYLLAKSIYEYDTYLQLLKGNLEDPELIMLGDTIPYYFHNENSYCDLFYSKRSQKLIAVTSLTNMEDEVDTDFSIYTISFPPFVADIDTDEDKGLPGKIVFGVLFSLIVVILTVILVKYYRKKEDPSDTGETSVEMDKPENDLLSQNSVPREKITKPANSILFFGGFQVINMHGEDITKKFTPLLKELFLLIFLHSIKDKGISVPGLTELLWFSMDSKSAKNNRAVNIAKLNNLLSEIDSFVLSRKTGYWQIVFDDSIVYNDYWSCHKIINHKKSLSKEDLLQFLNIINKGPLLGNVAYEWLDEFKLECSNQIIDSLIYYVDQNKIASDPELMIKLSDAILIFDMIHEEAISIKCKALTTLGKHSLAKEIYTKFSKDYLSLYDETFDRSFTDIIKN